MNRIFKVIWNKSTQRTEIVSELARGMAKSSSNSAVNAIKLVKPVLKLSLLSICLGYPTWVIAETNTDDSRFVLNRGTLQLDKNNGKYILGVYDAETGSFGFGKAQVGKKDAVWEGGKMTKPAAVGNYQLAIGHDTLIASGYKGIAIGSNYDSSASAGRRTYYFGSLVARQGGTQGAYAISLGSGAQAIGRHTLALGANSGNGGAYNGYDDAVFLGSLSRIKSVGQGREKDNINVNDLETKYTDAVTKYNNSQTQDALNKVIEAGRNINNAALNKVEGMTIKSNVEKSTATGSTFTTETKQVSQVNGSEGTTTVSILSVGGKDGNNTMYRQIQNVAAGRIASDSNDAVTGSQLYYVRNYTGWNIGHNSNNQETVTGRVNNDHTVIFKANDNYVNVSTTLDSTNKSTVNIGVNTSDISVTKDNGRITSVAANNPTNTVARNTVATATSVKTALETFNEVKADKNTKFTIYAGDNKVKDLTLGNNGTVNFKAEDGLEVESKNDAVVYKLNAESKQSIADAKAAATTVTNKLNEINKSVQRAETAAQTATNKAAEANTAATKAKASENAADTSAKTASNKAAEATAAAGKAKASETAAKASETAAKASETKAKESETNAKASETAAKVSETNAKASETAAKASETNAKASETAAKVSETNAKASETAAKESETNAKASETAAKASETNAKASETAAKASETNAKASETAAKASETNAKASETAAKESETNAKASETAAKESETNAKASETAAKASETNAKASETAAKASETNAKASETNAKASETNAKASEGAAKESETNAKTSEDNVKIIEKRIENSGLISKDGKTAFAADNSSGRNSAKASGKDSTAMGYGSEAKGDHSTALGNNAKAHAERSTAIGHNAEAKAAGSVALGEGSVAKEENTVSVGDIGHERRITNVQDPKNLTDAANKRYVDNSISSVRSELKQTDRKLRGGIAGAVAMANIPTVNRAGGTMVGIGVGSFKGQSAVAVGINRASDSNRVHFKMSGSATTSGDYAVGAGMGYQW